MPHALQFLFLRLQCRYQLIVLLAARYLFDSPIQPLLACCYQGAARVQLMLWPLRGMCQAGDLRRALASAERLCIVLGDEAYFEWRDVAVLYLHAGNLPAALAHLDAYASTPAAKGKTLSFDILDCICPYM